MHVEQIGAHWDVCEANTVTGGGSGNRSSLKARIIIDPRVGSWYCLNKL